jgi:Tfp pilus assembly PilM family ATPase
MSKMIIKSIAFNSESKRHMELLNWVENEQTNFSSYIRELLAIQYEKRNQSNNRDFGDDFDLESMI